MNLLKNLIKLRFRNRGEIYCIRCETELFANLENLCILEYVSINGKNRLVAGVVAIKPNKGIEHLGCNEFFDFANETYTDS